MQAAEPAPETESPPRITRHWGALWGVILMRFLVLAVLIRAAWYIVMGDVVGLTINGPVLIISGFFLFTYLLSVVTKPGAEGERRSLVKILNVALLMCLGVLLTSTFKANFVPREEGSAPPLHELLVAALPQYKAAAPGQANKFKLIQDGLDISVLFIGLACFLCFHRYVVTIVNSEKDEEDAKIAAEKKARDEKKSKKKKGE